MTVVIAHRGSHLPGSHIENTVPAFEHAVELGVGAVELDARLTADGVLIVHHDAHLGDGRAIVACAHGDLPAHVPTLAAALDACRGIVVNIEIKNDPADPDFDPDDGSAEAVAKLLAARPEGDAAWLISSFNRSTIDRWRQLAPGIASAWLTVEAVTAEIAAELAAAGHAAVHPWTPTVDAETIEHCQAAGVAVNTWTCNDLDVARRLIGWGIDGICTDVPGAVLSLLGERPT